MARRVELEPNAYRDMREHAAFITRLVSACAALRWNARLATALKQLADQAELWPLAEDPGLEDLDMRVAAMGRRPRVYRVLYDFDDERTVVHRIRHAAQGYLAGDDL